MSDTECPYCNAGQEINHDDGYGYEEDGIYEQECGYCDKVFAYTTSISFYHDAHKADCLNGGEHKYKETATYPRKYTKLECADCGDRQPLPAERFAELTEAS